MECLGRSRNPFSVTISAWISKEKHKAISIKLCRGNVYKACLKKEFIANPNNNKASDYTILLGDDENVIEDFVRSEIETFSKLYGLPKKRCFSYTINPKNRFSHEDDLLTENCLNNSQEVV